MNSIPFRPLSRESEALFVKDIVCCNKTHESFVRGNYYSARLGMDKEYIILPNRTLEVDVNVVVVKNVKEYRYKLSEFVKYFDTPHVKSLAEVNSSSYSALREYVETVYRTYGLNEDYKFQIDDIPLLLMKSTGTLAYEQGLGKTIVSLVTAKIRKVLGTANNILVIAQKDLIPQWQDEASKLGMALHRKNGIRYGIDTTKNYITHFEFITKYYSHFQDRFDMIILDEGHKIKSADAQRGKAIRELRAKYKLVLTGTPIKNIAKDLHFLMGWLVGFDNKIYPYKQHQQHVFRKDYGVYETKDGHRRIIPQVGRINELQLLVSPVILRRDINDIGVPMVKRTIYRVNVEMTPEQAKDYKAIDKQYIDATTKRFEQRKHSVLYPGNKKLEVTARLVNKILQEQEQVIIFTGIVDVSIRLLGMFSKGTARIANGTVAPDERAGLIKDFKDGKFPILIGGLEAINTGFSMQNANHVIVVDPPWNASTLDQAIARPYRINSKKDVNVYILCTLGTIDEDMLNTVDSKRDTAEIVLDNKIDFTYQLVNYNHYELKTG